MLSKTQKIALSIFAAMFVVPEVLWSPIANFIYSIWVGGNTPATLRDNFLIHSDYRKIAIVVVFIQCVGAFLGFIFSLNFLNGINKILLSILFFISFIFSMYVLYILLATINI